MGKKKEKLTTKTSNTSDGIWRTREHIIADLSINFVERLVLKCGYFIEPTRTDYGYDIQIHTFDEDGRYENEYIPLQLKATDNIKELKTEECFVHQVRIAHYQLWRQATMPVYFVLFDAINDEAYWLDIQDYDQTHNPRLTGQTIKLRIPQNHVLGMQSIHMMRRKKLAAVEKILQRR